MIELFYSTVQVPPLVASILAARQGLGNMAVSNAFGSNTFNILIGLGLPWFLYTIFESNDYSDLRDEGVTESVIFLGIALFLFLGITIMTGFVLTQCHAYVFIVAYMLFIIYVVTTVHEEQ